LIMASAQNPSPVNFFYELRFWFTMPYIEIKESFEENRFPLKVYLAAQVVLSLLVALNLEIFLSKLFSFKLYGGGFLAHYTVLAVFVHFLPIFAIALNGTVKKKKFAKRLSDVLLECGLVSPVSKKLPEIIGDTYVDEFRRMLKLRKNSVVAKDFQAKQDAMASRMQVQIEKINDLNSEGEIEIIYTTEKLCEKVNLPSFSELKPFEFYVGQSRSGMRRGDLITQPHILVAGATGGGKSTFLRQLICSLYLRNKKTEFSLIDLKGGLEMQLFDELPRVEVIKDISQAIGSLESHMGELQDRENLLHANRVKDIDELNSKDEIESVNSKKKFSFPLQRKILVIDEAAEIFTKNSSSLSTNDANKARSLATRIAAKGRALGIHLVIATQRPDRFSIDPLMKANIQHIICFPLPNNPSSMVVLDSNKATKLPDVQGRAYYKLSKLEEVQTPYLAKESAEKMLEPYRKKKKKKNRLNFKVAEEQKIEVKTEVNLEKL